MRGRLILTLFRVYTTGHEGTRHCKEWTYMVWNTILNKRHRVERSPESSKTAAERYTPKPRKIAFDTSERHRPDPSGEVGL